MYGDTKSGAAIDTPEIFGTIEKYIVATMTSDDFTTWDYTESEEVESFTVWNSDGTALWTSAVDISYCYANIALEVEPLIIDGVEYQAASVVAASIFNAYSVTEDEETDETIYTYIGSTINKVFESTLTEDNNYIVTVPRVMAYEHSTSIPEGYSISPMECIIIIYENGVYKMQPIGISEYYPD